MDRFGKGDESKTKKYLLMLAAFLESKPANTKRAYKTGLQQFFELFNWVCPEDVTVAHAVAFKKWLLEHRQVSETTTYLRMTAVSSFFEYLMKPPSATEQPLITSNPIKMVDRNDIQPTPYSKAKPMDWETFRTILDSLPPTPRGMRDKAILIFLAFTGRRRAEVARLRVRDLDVKARPRTYQVKVKGGAIKRFELPDVCYEAIRGYWLMADRLETMTPDSAVFAPFTHTALTQSIDPDKPLSVRTINRVLEHAAERAGVDIDDPSICIHAIRHMSARDLDEAGVRLQDIQAFLGHASPVTTQIYLDRLSRTAPAHTDVLLKVRGQAADLGRQLLEPS